MALLEILKHPDPRLRNKSVPVEEVTDEIKQIVSDMLETMYAAPGIGLASIQVNEPRSIVVIDLSEEKDQPLCLINPKITVTEGEQEYEEGCLSVPSVYETIQRAEQVTVEALDREGTPFELKAEGLLAICIQHELEHLEGKLFVDRLSKLKQQRIKKRLEKQAKETM
ncbi:MAG: peptide deformylase [Gammaproteobacteria bacterium]|jgi:peptide deformylase|nr:peptide deformylase [Gammaproteobacteria bacterium]MBT4607674.1 peptide deformylase [Thiotrichales bacterium]MBT3472566.1 peptide deformylase [Gammaproteobacteria bacterium]MBT3966406.1 peptide deformylase [Gammaproteobacteria bacterium]MBT4079830.1 peptide deformylase [Gammaproteobacteria bacterium]